MKNIIENSNNRLFVIDVAIVLAVVIVGVATYNPLSLMGLLLLTKNNMIERDEQRDDAYQSSSIGYTQDE